MMKFNNSRQITFLFVSTVLAATYLGIPQPAQAKNFFDKIGDALAPVVDVTDKRSAVRRTLREMDVTSPNSAACRSVKADGAGTAAEAAASAYGAPGAGSAILSILRGTCTKPGGSQNAAVDAAAQALAVEWGSRVKIKELEVQGRVQEVKIVNDTLLQLEQARQKGETQRVDIIQTALVDMTRAKTAAEIEKSRHQLEAIKNTNTANVEMANINAAASVKIEELKQKGKVDEAKVMAETLQKKVEAEQQGETERAKILNDALVEMTKANTSAQVEQARISANKEITTNLTVTAGDLISSVIRSSGSRKEQKIAAETERQRIAAEVEKAKIAAEVEKVKNASFNADLNLVMIQNWGLTVTTCSGSVVSISMDGKQYCTNVANWLNAGRYQYIRAEDRLEPMYQVSQSLNTNTSSQVKPDYGNINANTNSQPQADNDNSL